MTFRRWKLHQMAADSGRRKTPSIRNTMANVLGYGEDSLTLWLLKDNLTRFLNKFQDSSRLGNCQVLYRPSFGRGADPLFGEFDAIVLSENCLYLCESKWDDLKGRVPPRVKLKDAQFIRHKMFTFYVHEWVFGSYASWERFSSCAVPKWEGERIQKSIPPSGKLLARNLRTVLGLICNKYSTVPEIKNVLIYFHNGFRRKKLAPEVIDENKKVVAAFDAICVNYADALDTGNYITFS